MKLVQMLVVSVLVVTGAGCAAVPPDVGAPQPVRYDELAHLSKQGLSDDAIIAVIVQRGVSFVLSQRDMEALREVGLSEGLRRYLQGRSDGEQSAALAGIRRGRYLLPLYDGPYYRGYPYLRYHDGAHFYGGPWYFYGGISGHAGGHHGRSHGGHHGGGHH